MHGAKKEAAVSDLLLLLKSDSIQRERLRNKLY